MLKTPNQVNELGFITVQGVIDRNSRKINLDLLLDLFSPGRLQNGNL